MRYRRSTGRLIGSIGKNRRRAEAGNGRGSRPGLGVELLTRHKLSGFWKGAEIQYDGEA
jgi:hypothetical protein